MTFKEWKFWFKNLDSPLKWFIIVILIRPIVDNFYTLKEISPFLSPLYILGALTPLLTAYAIAATKKPNYSRLDLYFGWFAILAGISSFTLLISDAFAFDAIDATLKFTIPLFLYFFSRRIIKSKHDLHGIFQTFMYSTLVVVTVYTYEMIFGPIRAEISRGFERFNGGYSDVMNYAIYAAGSLLIGFYAFIEKPKTVKKSTNTILLIVIIVYVILILFNIHHTSSYAVITSIIVLFLIHNFRDNIGLGLIALTIAISVFYAIGPDSITDKVSPLVQTDIQVYEGEKENEQLLHGRVGRWMNFLDFFNSKSSFVQFLGLPLGMDHPYSYLSKGAHNDFMRTLMFTGYLGLITYIIILINLILRVISHKVSISFLGAATLASLILYSVSTTPLLYASLLYLVMPIISLMALPKKEVDY